MDCPKVTYDMSTKLGTIVSDNWITLSSELAEFDYDTYTFSGIFFSSLFEQATAQQLQVSDLIINIYDSNGNPVCGTDGKYSDGFDSTVIDDKWTRENIGSGFQTNYLANGSNLELSPDVTFSTGNIDSTSDNFSYMYQRISGDFDVKMEIKEMNAWGPTGSGGLMFRVDNTSTSQHVSVIADSNKNVKFIYRDTAGGSTTVVASNTASSYPLWVRLTRSGNTYKAYYSTDDGATWTQVGTAATLTTISSSGLIGNAFVANGASAKAVYDNFVVCTRLESVVDLVEDISLCAPHTSSYPVACSSSHAEGVLSLHFTNDISQDTTSSVVQLAIQGGPSAQFDISSHTGTSASDGTVTLDMTGAEYDSGTWTLRNIRVINLKCADYDVSDITVTFPDNGGTINLKQINNDPTGEIVCSPESISPASCSGQQSTGNTASEESINVKLEFKDNIIDKSVTSITLTVKYDCGQNCSGTLSASYDVNSQSGGTSSDSNFKIDMSKASLSGDKKKLENIVLTNLDSSKQFILVTVSVTFNGNAKIKKVKDTTNNNNICDFGGGKTSVAQCNPDYLLEVSSQQSGGGTTAIYTFDAGICDFYISPYLSSCTINWQKSNTCGIKYVLNTILALKFQVVSSEFNKTQPIVKSICTRVVDNKCVNDIYLFKASFDYPKYRGHLIRYKLLIDSQTGEVTLSKIWDAGDDAIMPKAGATGNNPSSPTKSNTERYIYTVVEDSQTGSLTKIDFDISHLTNLKSYIGQTDDTAAQITVHSVRGRKDSSAVNPPGPSGSGEATDRLWAIENSTPALMTNSKLVTKTDSSLPQCRDIIVFVGADDGMLHAFHAGTGTYNTNAKECVYDEGTGKEIWAYIPSSLLSSLKEQPFNVKYNPNNPLDYSIFEPRVSVDGSPAIGDFLVNVGTEANPDYKWKTYLVGTAEIRNTQNSDHNKGILFALDVTNPYAITDATGTPNVLWERMYYDGQKDANGNYKKCGMNGTQPEFNCNMGRSKGVAIGSINVGDKLQSVAFVTARWAVKQTKSINTKGLEYDNDYCSIDAETEGTCSDTQYTTRTTCQANGGTWTPKEPPTDCVYGLGVYAIDINTGNVIWNAKVPYTGDAVNIADTAAIPALMDIDENGSYDFVVFGDVQGRLWAFNAVTGESLAGYDSLTKDPVPVFTIPDCTTWKKDTQTGLYYCSDSNPQDAGPSEPIGAPVSVKGNIVVFGTGASDSDFASDTKKYHIFVLRMLTHPVDNKYYEILLVDTTAEGEKVWAKPLITADYKVIISTARKYKEAEREIAGLQTEGRFRVIDLKSKTVQTLKDESGKDWFEGGVVGGIDAEAGHAFAITLKGNVYVLGSKNAGSFSQPPEDRDNPYNILWWRKL